MLLLLKCPAWLRLLLLCLMGTGAARACSVPVFRYALERWQAAPYELFVFHLNPLSPAQQASLARFSQEQATNLAPPNLGVEVVDLNGTNVTREHREIWKRHQTNATPAMVLQYPRGAEAHGACWAGPFDEGVLKRFLDSPVRREIARRLGKGDSAVWLLMESGNKAADDAAATLLQTRLKHLQEVLKPSKLAPEDIANGLVSVPESQLRVAFSILRFSRNDPAEDALTRMILDSEDDLRQEVGPIAVPVFGRGRALFAFVGSGIKEENIDEACHFLVGPCSCVVKEQNPGFDLLMSTDWDSLVQFSAVAQPEIPELTGLTSLAGKSNAAPAPTTSPSKPATAGDAAPIPVQQGTLKFRLLAIFGIGALILVAGTVLLLRQRR